MKRPIFLILAILWIACSVEEPTTATERSASVVPYEGPQSSLIPCEAPEQCGTLSECGFDSPPDTPLCAPSRYCCILPTP